MLYGAAAAIVKRHDGHLDKFIGDCVMVVFGFDVSREDDAVRALRAALAIHRTVSDLNSEELRPEPDLEYMSEITGDGPVSVVMENQKPAEGYFRPPKV
ncbi:MAG: adenylate/guanylate cyclase domain-containing protein [Spirochaetota bacterium]